MSTPKVLDPNDVKEIVREIHMVLYHSELLISEIKKITGYTDNEYLIYKARQMIDNFIHSLSQAIDIPVYYDTAPENVEDNVAIIIYTDEITQGGKIAGYLKISDAIIEVKFDE